MKRPSALVYGVDDTPPARLLWLAAFQHLGMITVFLVVPLAVCRAARLSPEASRDVLSLTLLALGIGTLLQSLRRGPLGCGYLAPNGPSAIYLGPALIAAQAGGIALVLGMTFFAGAVEAAASRVWHRLRPYLPIELSGLVVMMIGVSFAALGVRIMLGGRAGGPLGAMEWGVAGCTLLVTVVLNVWARGLAKLVCALIGLAAGYVMAAVAGVATEYASAHIGALPLVDAPGLGHVAWAFDPALMLPFAVAGVAVALNTSASVTVYQRLNDADWVRPEMSSVRRATLTDGVVSMMASAIGAYGLTVLAAGTGLIAATQVAARRIALPLALLAMAAAFLPRYTALMVATPDPVVAGAAFFASAFVIANGMQIITSRMLDARRSLAVGLGMITSIAVLMFPAAANAAPDWLRPIGASPLVAGVVVAFVLNLFFRLGVRQKVSTTIAAGGEHARAIEDFLNQRGAAWGARQDVVRRAIFGVTQLVETVVEHGQPQGDLALEASFDEFNLDVVVRYPGQPLEFPEGRPKDAEILASDDGARRLAGYMLRRNADRIQSSTEGGVATVQFHFDH
jgi:NCS2 family nucleobase:cation symporter-2